MDVIIPFAIHNTFNSNPNRNEIHVWLKKTGIEMSNTIMDKTVARFFVVASVISMRIATVEIIEKAVIPPSTKKKTSIDEIEGKIK